ncbi:MAG: S-layer homology domain-containing protein [Oscillospiraceae bacterium]|nr:S-layer homology domain-containing protein [Oscillospiraceae bacterium]
MKKLLCIFLLLLLTLQLPLSAAATEPIVTEPVGTEPVVTEPTEPVVTEPTEPIITEPTEPVVTEPTEPVVTEPTEPVITEPTEPTEPDPEPREDEVHTPYLSGYTDGSFRPNKTVSRAELAVMIYKLGDYPDGPSVFPDIQPGKWYAKAVNALAAAGIFSGYSDGSFGPNDSVSRAQMVAVLRKLSGIPEPQDQPSFPDVSTEYWAWKAIAIAYEQGWVSGYPDGSFRPKNPVSRAQAVVMLNRFLDRHADQEAIEDGIPVRFFPDVIPGKWYYLDVLEATNQHTAHYEAPTAPERWLDTTVASANLADGFYCIGTNLFFAKDGDLIHSAGSGVFHGVSYSCAGSSGVCTARTEVLRLATGELILLHGGKPLYALGAYPEAFYVKAGQLYAARNGAVVCRAGSDTLNGVSYSCAGASGVCTVSDWTALQLADVDLSIFDKHLTAAASATDSTNLTIAQAVRAAVEIYESYFRVEYPLSGGSDQLYLEKALAYGILSSLPADGSKAVTRGDAALYLWRALRGRELEAVNTVERIPDLNADSPYYSCVMILYKAGVMGGVGTDRKAELSGNLSVSDFAALVKRLERRSERLRFTLLDRVIKSIQYGTSGSGRYPLTVWQIGNGNNVMLLTFAIHGWEDNWNRDGEELVYLADQLKSYLENHYDLVRQNHWTVYIFRCLNPDGLYLGTTCNGPGRCTTTYYNANGQLISGSGKGIDMNRCFPYKFQARTDARNFNGTAPLQCAEARALASFIQNHKGSGHNICVDTHGWYGQIITSSGKGTLYNAFAKQFPNSTYTYLSGGSGYLTGWTGFVQGFDSCLLELPKGISSHSSFLNAGCVWRFENAITELLQHYNGPNATKSPRDYIEVELDGN